MTGDKLESLLLGYNFGLLVIDYAAVLKAFLKIGI